MKNKINNNTILFAIAVISLSIFQISESYSQTYLVNTGKIIMEGSSQLTVDNLTNNSGSNLNLNGGILNIKGNFVNSGSYDGTGTISFSGSSQQTLSGISTYNNLTINNANGVLLSSDVTVDNNITLANGILTLGTYNLTLNSSASITGSFSSTKMINASGTGQMIKKFSSATSFVFPIGDNSEYSPLSINFTSGTFAGGAYIGTNLKNLKHPNNSSASDYLNRYWVFTPFGISDFSYDLTLNYNTGDVIGSENNIYLGKFYSDTWTLYNQANIINHTLSLSNATSFGDYTGGQQGAMPVELISFVSFLKARDIELKWTTNKEINNSGFNIERLNFENNQEIWTQVGFVKGNGTKNSISEYNFTDKNLPIGKFKYRLKQTDFNGNFSIYNLQNNIEIFKPVKYFLSQNYPNPFNPKTKIDFELPDNDRVSLKIFDMTGRNMCTLINNEVRNAGYYTIDFNLGNLSSGVYFYKLETEKFTQVKKMAVIK